MDQLSNGVSVRQRAWMFEEEGHALYRNIIGGEVAPPSRSRIFTRIVDYFGHGVLTFPAGSPIEAVPMLTKVLEATTVRWLVDHLDVDEMAARHRDSDYTAKMNAQHDARWAAAGERKLERAAVVTTERAFLFNDYEQPAMGRAMLAGIGPVEFMRRSTEYRQKHGEGSPKRLGQWFRRLAPALEISAQVFAGRQMQRARRTSQQDFWDIEHAATGYAYADAFVTLDGGLAALLCRPWIPPSAKARLVTTIEGLVELLRRYA